MHLLRRCGDPQELKEGMKKARKKKTARRKKGHFAIGSVMNLDRRQSPERRADKILGEFETCLTCLVQKRRGTVCPICFGGKR